eukprot:1846274-Pyramimonas_sp.AAC.4
MDRQGGLGSWDGKDDRPARSKYTDKAEHGGSTHAQEGHGGQAADPMENAHTDTRASGPPSQS